MKYENKLIYTRPLDLLFARLEEVLSAVVADFGKPVDAQSGEKSHVPQQSHSERIDKLYHALSTEEREAMRGSAAVDPSKDQLVCRFFMASVRRIQELTTVIPETQGEQDKKKTEGLILISLYDLKIFNAMLTFLVVDGIHSCLPTGVGVPIGLRTKQFGLAVSDKSVPTTPDFTSDSLNQLNDFLTSLVEILACKGDVRDLLLLGPYTADFLSAAAAVAFNSTIPKAIRTAGIASFNFIERQIDSYSLYMHLTSLIRPKTPAWFIGGISHSLAIVPLQRSDGVKSLLEFVSGIREKDDIQLSDLDRATRILKSVPRNVPLDTYSMKIGLQLLKIIATPSSTLTVPTLQLVTALFSQRPDMINLGLRKIINGRLNPELTSLGSTEDVIVSQHDLDEALVCLYLFVTKSHATDLISALTDSIFLSLWSLVCYLTASKKASELATSLLVSILQQNEAKTSIYIRLMSENLLMKNYSKYWKYAPSANGGAEIRQLVRPETGDLLATLSTASLSGGVSNVFDEIETRVKKFAEILDLVEETEISSYFVSLLGEWLTDQQGEDPFRALTTTRLLEAILEKSRKKLLKSPEDIISVVHSALKDFVSATKLKLGIKEPKTGLQAPESTLLDRLTLADSDDEDDEKEEDSDDEQGEGGDEGEQVVQLCFSLISAILMELDADADDTGKNDTILRLQRLTPFIAFVQKHGSTSQIKSQARICHAKLDILVSDPAQSETMEVKRSSQHTFMKALQLMEDPSPPVQAHGMHLLKTLIESKDKNVEPKVALSLYLTKLGDKDSFIYLTAIKGLEALAGRYRFKVVTPLIKAYKDQKSEVDVRLRVGEVLLKFIETYGRVLQVDQASTFVQTLISVVARHEEKDEENDLLRMSAMSILGSFYEEAPGFAGCHLEDALDCALQILRLETQSEKSIMRRSAISLIASILKGPFGTSGIMPADLNAIKLLVGVASRDEDPLVRLQATTALEIMEDVYGGI